MTVDENASSADPEKVSPDEPPADTRPGSGLAEVVGDF
jgi:hypothetical protein